MHKWKTTQPYKEKLKPTDTSNMNGSQKSLPWGKPDTKGYGLHKSIYWGSRKGESSDVK